LKRGSMRFWLCASGALWLIALSGALVKQCVSQPQLGKTRVNEVSLAGLQPGKASLKLLRRKWKSLKAQENKEGAFVLDEVCYGNYLFVDADKSGAITVIRLAKDDTRAFTECEYKKTKVLHPPFATGRGLTINNRSTQVIQIYGEPTSRSPSTKNGQPLELLYYAFDWAGPDVPQVMEVVCTAPKDGTPGRVVEITLAASSL